MSTCTNPKHRLSLSHMTRKIVLGLMLFLSLFYALPTPTFAQASTPALQRNTWYNPDYATFQNKVFTTAPDSQVFGERYTYAQVVWIIHSFALILRSGLAGQSFPELCNIFSGQPCRTSSLPSSNNLASLGISGLLIQSLGQIQSNRPASLISESRSFLSKFDLAAPANAQGYGFSTSNAIRPLWAAMRNSAYLVMVLLLVVAGFMMMFRVKVNAQTAVTIQLLIPRIILTLLAVTFSFAIAGLIIDLTYLVVAFVIGALASTSSGIVTNFQEAITFFVSPGYFEKLFIFYLWPFLLVLFGAISLPGGSLTGPIVIIMGLVTLILLFRVWWMMVKNYIMLIFLIIFGPWQIMLGVLPSSTGFTGWLRTVIAHCAVYAVVPLMFLANYILWWSPISGLFNLLPADVQSIITNLGGTGIQPINFAAGTYPSFPLFSAQDIFFALFASWAVLALMPKAADMVKDALKVSAFKYQTAFGEALGAGGMFGAASATSRRAGAFLTPFSPRIGGTLSTVGASGGILENIGARLSKFKP